MAKKKQEPEKEEYTYYDNSIEIFFFGVFFMGFIAVVFFAISMGSGVFNKSALTDLNIDKDKLATDHVLKHYPEYGNCTIIYGSCVIKVDYKCEEGVEIFCNEVDNRNGLRTSVDKEPSEILIFDGITIEDLLEEKVQEFVRD